MDDYEIKNYELIRENIGLKDKVKDLEASAARAKDKYERLDQDFKSITSDLIYLYSKVNTRQR